MSPWVVHFSFLIVALLVWMEDTDLHNLCPEGHLQRKSVQHRQCRSQMVPAIHCVALRNHCTLEASVLNEVGKTSPRKGHLSKALKESKE